MNELIRRNITLKPEDYTTVRKHAQEWGQSFSAALRLIIREWERAKRQPSQPQQTKDQPES
jgi:hypothetical protein